MKRAKPFTRDPRMCGCGHRFHQHTLGVCEECSGKEC